MTVGEPPLDVTTIGESLAAILAWLSRRDVHSAIMRRARCDLPARLVWLLTRLAASGPVRAGELASDLNVTTSTLSPQLQRLERDGYIERSVDSCDRRASQLRISRKGQQLLKRLNSARAETLEIALSSWPEAERTSMSAMLARVAGSLAKPMRPAHP